jgi:hypothetical protein
MALAPSAQLKHMALAMAHHTLQRAQSLKPERLKIEERLKEIEAVMDAADLCHQRARDSAQRWAAISSAPVAGFFTKRKRA